VTGSKLQEKMARSKLQVANDREQMTNSKCQIANNKRKWKGASVK
jgi:hypothetical protein